MNITCYLDETGTHDERGLQPGSDVAGVIGWLALDEQWERFCRLWKQKLRAFDIKVFHYSEWNDWDRSKDDPAWPYYGWSEKKRHRFISDLIPIARDNTLLGIGAFVSVPDYDRLTPDWLKELTQHPYHFCFQFFFNWLLDFVIEQSFVDPLPAGEQIAVVCDRQIEFKAKALETFEAIKEVQDIYHRLGTITFDADKAKYPPLQAADLLAARQRKVHSRVVNKRHPSVTPGGWDEEMGKRHNLAIGYYDASNLPQAIEETIENYRRLGIAPK